MRLLLASLLLVGAPPPAAVPPSLAATGQSQDVRFGRDSSDRMTVAVHVGDNGPYRFLVDTGAERTVISRQLAEHLGLAAGVRTRMQSVAGSSDTATVDIPALHVSARKFAVIGAPALESDNIGADGLLGVDSLAGSQVMFDFRAGRMAIGPSTSGNLKDEPGTIVVEARRRHGRLMFTHAMVEGRGAMVVVDTGSQVSIGNMKLRRRLLGDRPIGTTAVLRSVAGEALIAEIHAVKALDIDGITLKNLEIAFIDSQIFRQLDVDDRPALLLGMNAMRAFDKVSIDFAARRVRFVLPGTGMADGPRLASR